jgi:hypothetical protein
MLHIFRKKTATTTSPNEVILFWSCNIMMPRKLINFAINFFKKQQK